MSFEKKLRRQRFRDSVFKRDKDKCKTCGLKAVDAHHITNRNDIPNGGYVKENGISLCADCHIKAEEDDPEPGFTADELYELIGSSEEKAFRAAERL